jgi:maltose alpha-D-glucosyltransferase/alpha-amylase
MQDERFVHAVVAQVGRGTVVEVEGGRLSFQPTAAFAELAGDEVGRLPTRVLGADSSNTAVALGERLLFKAFRRLQPGINPEVEIGAFLTDVVPFDHVARVAGAIHFDRPDGRYTLGVLQEFVLNQGDGWRFAREYLEHYLERHSGTEPALASDHGGFEQMIAILGTRTAELHLALARPTGDPAFDPEPVTREAVAGWAERIAADVQLTVDRLAAARDGLPPAAHEAAERVNRARDALAAHARALGAAVDPTGLCCTRLHGDYHVGQVLVAKNDFVIVDFEGEPQRGIEERRAKHSPLRDVAGMLRSFDYVRHAARAKVEALQPSARLAELSDAWAEASSRVFLDAYRARAESSCLTGDWSAARQLVDLFTLEKALYEVRYELDNRPDRLVAPLGALVRIAGG